MSVTTVTALVDLLRQHRLLEGLQLDEAARLQTSHADPRSLAKELLQRGWLTPYQVNQILTGKVQDLVLGSYILLERLGEGGMGQVFKARQPKLNRLVAIKVIRKERLKNAEAVKRFQREMRASSSLDHPNIVKAVDADQVGENLILVMEYVEGIDLSKRVKQSGPLPVDQAVEYMRQAGHGLQHACDRGLVHRDIKPANLLVAMAPGAPSGGVGTIKILDMGLARIIRPDDSDDDNTASGTITQEGFVMGTLDFLAPEQAQDSHNVDIRADLYALGCTFYFILTGQVPFPGGSPPEKLLKHRLDEPAPIEKLRPEVPGSVAAVVRCLMAKKPAERYQTPEALALALADIKAGVPVAIPVPATAMGSTLADPLLPAPTFTLESASDTPMAMPVADTESSRPTAAKKLSAGSQRRLLIGGIAGGACLVFGLALLTLFGGSSTPSSTQQAKETRPERKPSPLDQLDRKLIPPGELAAYQPQELVAVLGQHKNGAWNQAVERRRHAGPVHAVAFSPNGKQIASGGADHAIRIWDPKLPKPIGTLAGHRGAVMGIAYLTDGNRLVSGSMANEVFLWDVAGGKPIQQFQGHTDGVQAVAISPNGQQVLSGGRDKTVRLWDVASGNELWKSEAHNETVWAVAFSPDGQQALSGSRDKTARLWDVESGKELQQLVGHTTCIHTVAFLPGGRQGLTGSCDRTLRLWDLPSGKLIRRYTGHQGQIDSVKLTSDGQQALSGSWDKTLRLWNVGAGNEIRQFLGHEDMVWSAALSPDGKRAVSGSGGVNQEGRIQPGNNDNTVRLWDVASGSELIPFEGATGPFYGVDFSPDGKHLITAGADGVIRVWDLLLMKEVRRLEGHRNQVWDVTYSPDGKVALSGSEDRTVRLWDLTQGTELKRFEERSRPVHRVVFGPDGRRALASGDAALWVWDVHTGQELGRFKGHTDTILCVDWKGTRAVSGSADKSVRIWNTDTGQEVNRFDGHTTSVLAVALSPDGRWAASGAADQSIRVYDLKTNTIARRYDCAGPVTGLAFAPNSLVLASSDLKGVITLRDLTGNKLKEWTLPGPVQRVVWSEDGRHLACANQNGTAYVLRYDTSAVAVPR